MREQLFDDLNTFVICFSFLKLPDLTGMQFAALGYYMNDPLVNALWKDTASDVKWVI